jgi:hypothetical protein
MASRRQAYRLSLACLAALGMAGGLAIAQAPLPEVSIRTTPSSPPSLVLHTDTNLVETNLTIRDGHGHAISGLRAADLEVLDNGVPQQIVPFSELRSGTAAKAVPARPEGTDVAVSD